MLLKDEVGMLKQVPLFAGIAPAKLKLLAFTSDRVTYAPGQIIVRQGEVGDAAYVVLSGSAEVLVDSPSGQIKVAELQPNAIVGEIAILSNQPRTATVRAKTAVETLRIRKDHFLRMLGDHPEISVEIMRVLADRLTHTTAELTEERSKRQATQ
jgi:CRP-like cAMP-binding protein